ncbi:MAG: hypothetical protein GPI94_14500 [Microcystis aeruginosa LG13-03]|nr:hypothetical protein [Microcystis aeruginosa LG13-13]NCR05095.1 hypothetical protein [Microcystis aeruginosa LG13-03]NCR63350.1 hypothetical protein [Microcystis aeruginosa LG11-05]
MLTQERVLAAKKVQNLSNYSIVVLFFALAVWVVVPIVGIFPLLLSVQLNLLKPGKKSKSEIFLNNLLLILVVFTVSVFFSSVSVKLDLIGYIADYQQLDRLTPFEAAESYGAGFEFIIYLLAYPVYYLTNGAAYAFLFNHALIINTLVVFVISKRLSAKYYPILLMIVFSTPSYYFQMQVMRHALSNTFLMAAITTIESSGISFFVFLFLSAFSHFSNFIYFAILVFLRIITKPQISFLKIFNLKNIKIRENKKPNRMLAISILGLILIVALLGFFIGISSLSPIISFVQELGFSDIARTVETRSIYYEKYNEGAGLSIILITYWLFMGIGGLISILDKQNISTQKLALTIIFLIQFIVYIFVVNTGFAWRACFLLLSMNGLFYALIIESKLTKIKLLNIMVFSFVGLTVVFSIRIFLVQLAQGWLMGEEHIFFGGQPLQMNLFDYIKFFIDATPID